MSDARAHGAVIYRQVGIFDIHNFAERKSGRYICLQDRTDYLNAKWLVSGQKGGQVGKGLLAGFASKSSYRNQVLISCGINSSAIVIAMPNYLRTLIAARAGKRREN
jgi:hypothetical protein